MMTKYTPRITRWLLVFFAPCVMSLANVMAQDTETDEPVFPVKYVTYITNINYPAYSVKASVCANCKRVNPYSDRMYHWISYNDLKVTQGGYEGRLLHGKYVVFYLNDQLKEKGTFKSGLKNGLWISWYNNGVMQTNEHWKNGRKHGNFKEFYSDGSLRRSYRYRRNKLHGKMTSYEEGKQVDVERYRRGKPVIKVEKMPVQKTEKAVIPVDTTSVSGKPKYSLFKFMHKKDTVTTDTVNIVKEPSKPVVKNSQSEKRGTGKPGTEKEKKGQGMQKPELSKIKPVEKKEQVVPDKSKSVLPATKPVPAKKEKK